MPVTIKSTGGGSVTLTAPSTASDLTLTLPSSTGTVALTSSQSFANPTFTGNVTFPGTGIWNSSGNVGIGTSSPATALDVSGVIRANNEIRSQLNNTFYSLYNTAGTRYGYWQGTSGAIIIAAETGASNVLTFNTNSTERARIDSSGNFLINRTATGFVSVNGFSYELGAGTAVFGHVNGTADGTAYAYFTYNTSSIGYISQNGTTGVTYSTTSDYRLKENARPITDGLDTISALKPVRYDWISDKSAGEGFIAHELQEVIPLAVTGEKDAVNEDGSIKPQGVDCSRIVVHLVAACQEQQKLIVDLQDRLAKAGL